MLHIQRRLRRDKPNSFQKVEFQGPKVKWFQPTSLLELTSCFARNPDARLVSGCTSEEFRPEQPGFVKCSVIQISRLKELHSFEVYDNHVCIGAGLTVTDIERHLTETVSKLPGMNFIFVYDKWMYFFATTCKLANDMVLFYDFFCYSTTRLEMSIYKFNPQHFTTFWIISDKKCCCITNKTLYN